VSGNLDIFIEVMWILLMELDKVVYQSNCIQRTARNISYRMAAPHYVMLCICLFVMLGKQ